MIMVTLYDLGISISFIVGNSKISVKNAAESEKDYDRDTAIGTLKLIVKLGYTIKTE